MKILLIKVGKAFATLKREGFFRGGKRIWKSFFAMFRFVGKGDVLFVTGGVGDSALYRAHHSAEELKFNGFKCSITVQDNPFLVGYAKKFKVFIFHRTLFTPAVEKMIKEIKNQKKEIIFETDDLVYDPQYLKFMDYFKKMNSFERKLYEKGVGGEILADSYVKACTTTTTFLADKLREKNKKVFIVPNKLSLADLEIAEKIIQHATCNMKQESKKMLHATGYMSNDVVRIGYFSGTISHNKDFATITDALMQIMEKHQNVELVLVGPLDTDNVLNKFNNRISHLPYVPREKHFENLASVEINVAPLEIDNPFCEAKSELKFFEAAVVGVPTVALKNQTFSEAIEDGVDGFLASSTDEWMEKLEKLILDPNLRQEMGQKAREKAIERYTTKNANNIPYYDYLRSKINI